MKTIIVLLSTIILPLYSAHQWNWKSPSPQGNTLYSIQFNRSSYGYAVGENGTIMASTNGGASWDIQYEGVTDHLRDLSVADSITAWIVGDNGTILKTTNGGTQWFPQSSGVTDGLNGVFFYDKSVGCAVGDTKIILMTADGGTTWSRKTLSGVPNSISLISAYFITKLEGWITGTNGIILHTVDGGNTWSNQGTVGSTGMKIKFINSTSGIIVGDNGLIAKTTNSGATWAKLISNTTNGLNDIEIISESEYWISGDNGQLLHTSSGGISWVIDALPTYASVYGCANFNGTIITAGEFGFLAAKKGNDAWQIVNSGIHKNINWLGMNQSGKGIAVGDYGFMSRTSDHGATWIEFSNGVTGDSFYGCQMNSSGKSWVVGDLGVLLYSSNAGNTWQQQTTNTFNTLFSVTFIDDDNGWAVGFGGVIIHTTNGGTSWMKQQSTVSNSLYGVQFTSVEEGWISGENGLLLHSTNGGGSWSTVSSGITNSLFTIYFGSKAVGFAVGSKGAMLRTTDAGASWINVQTGTTKNIYSIAGNNKIFWAVGDSGCVLYSQDMGEQWNLEFASSGYEYLDVITHNDSLVMLCGVNSTILSYDMNLALTVKSSGEMMPGDFTLSQNYPNPFNPSTTIEFTMPYSTTVSLVIYDVMGRQVAVLVNDRRDAGANSVRWDASSCAAGIYFARLRSGENTICKKMILMK